MIGQTVRLIENIRCLEEERCLFFIQTSIRKTSIYSSVINQWKFSKKNHNFFATKIEVVKSQFHGSNTILFYDDICSNKNCFMCKINMKLFHDLIYTNTMLCIQLHLEMIPFKWYFMSQQYHAHCTNIISHMSRPFKWMKKWNGKEHKIETKWWRVKTK